MYLLQYANEIYGPIQTNSDLANERDDGMNETTGFKMMIQERLIQITNHFKYRQKNNDHSISL